MVEGICLYAEGREEVCVESASPTALDAGEKRNKKNKKLLTVDDAC